MHSATPRAQTRSVRVRQHGYSRASSTTKRQYKKEFFMLPYKNNPKTRNASTRRLEQAWFIFPLQTALFECKSPISPKCCHWGRNVCPSYPRVAPQTSLERWGMRGVYARGSVQRQLNCSRSPTPRPSKQGRQLRLSVSLQFSPHITSANLAVEVVKKLSATARLAFSELDPG